MKIVTATPFPSVTTCSADSSPRAAKRPDSSAVAKKMVRPEAGRPFWSRTVAVMTEVLCPSAVRTSGLALSCSESPSSEGPSSSGMDTS